MRSLKRIIFVIMGGTLAVVLADAHPQSAQVLDKSLIRQSACDQQEARPNVLISVGAKVLTGVTSRVVNANIPYTINSKSVGIDGQIWVSGNNYLEFHDSPSVTAAATLKHFSLAQRTEANALVWRTMLVADVAGNAHLKRMLARTGAHNTVALQKRDVGVDIDIALLPAPKSWFSTSVTVISPESIPVTAETSIWGIGIGAPFSVPVPAGQVVARFSHAAPYKLEGVGVKATLEPERASIGKQNTYCVTGIIS
jgi:hypothetical protein